MDTKNKVKLLHDERYRIERIRRDFNTRNKWSKQDYSDFYYEDTTLFLAIIDRVFPKPDICKCSSKRLWADQICMKCGGKTP